MKKSLIILLLVLAIGCSLLVGCNTVKKGEEVLLGGSFDDYTGVSGSSEDIVYLDRDWTLMTAESEDGSAFSVADGNVTIDTSNSGYASLKQTVYLKSNAYYKVKVNYTITATVEEFSTTDDYTEISGFWIGFDEDANYNRGNDPAPEIDSEKKASGNIVESYFHTKAGVNKATLTINVGAKEAPVKTSVTVKSISLVQVSKSALVNNEDNTDLLFSVKDLAYTEFNMATDVNVPYVVVGAIFIAILMYFAYVLLARYMAAKMDGGLNANFETIDSKPWIGLLIALGSALLVRLVATFALAGSSSNFLTLNLGYDAVNMSNQASALVNQQGGTVWFLKYNDSALFEPVRLLLLAVCGAFGLIFDSANDVLISNTFFIRLVAIIADVLTIWLIYRGSRKYIGNIGASIMAMAYGLLPLTFAMSSVWGSWTSVTVFLAVLTFSLILEQRNYLFVALTFFVACMFDVWMIWLAPIIILWTIRKFVKNKSSRIPIIASVVGGFILFYLISLPFTIGLKGQELGSTISCYELFFDSIIGEKMYVYNAFNFQAILGNNMTTITTASLVIGIIYIVFVIALAIMAYLKSPNTLDIMLVAAAYLALVYMFGNRMQATYIYVAIALLYLYGLVSKDKRVIFSAVLYSIFAFVNFAYLYLLVDYSAGAPQIAYDDGVMYTFSAFNLILTLYVAYLAYDICIENRTVTVAPLKITWVSMWGFRLKKVGEFFVKAGNAIAVFFKTVFSKAPQDTK